MYGVSEAERKELGLPSKKKEEVSHVRMKTISDCQNPFIDIHHHKKNPNPLSCKKKKKVAPPQPKV